MKDKWATLVNMQPEIYYQNYHSFYPSEPFTLDHIIMRHPVCLKIKVDRGLAGLTFDDAPDTVN